MRGRVRGRHPSPVALGAWFDGESDDDLSPHIVACERCRQRVQDMEQIRSALRGGTASGGTVSGLRRPKQSRARTALAPMAIAATVLIVGAAMTTTARSRTSSIDAGRAVASRGGGSGGAGAAGGPAGTVPLSASAAAGGGVADTSSAVPAGQAGGLAGQRAGAASPGRAASAARAPSRTTPATHALHLATIVPLSGPMARDGAASAQAVRDAVDAANRTGGVAGQPVELRVVGADDRSALAALAGWADGVVGGFGATPPASVPWLVPADASIAGSRVVAAEVSPSDAGKQLAESSAAENTNASDGSAAEPSTARSPQDAVVGVIEGDGPDAALADAFTSQPAAQVVRLGRGSRCDDETLSLRRARATTLVLALSPPSALACADAALRAGWDPAGGVVVAPTVAYAAGDTPPLSLHHARTVLGFPWPTSQAAGAARFRAAAPGVMSYRALVSFAAAELAIQAARVNGTLDPAALVNRTWTTDLLVLDHGRNADAAVVAVRDGGWEPV